MRKNLLKNEHLASTVQIVLGCALGALAYPLFLVPNHIAPGGLTGLATVLNYLFHWPVGTTSLLMNIPLFIIGYRAMGRVFVIRSLVATVLFSVLIDLIPLPPATGQPLLGAVLGGVLLGAGLGFVLRGGATAGGLDLHAPNRATAFGPFDWPLSHGRVYGEDDDLTGGWIGNKAWQKMGVMAVEMEAAALYMNAARTGKHALAICTVSDHLLRNENCTAEERQNGFTNMMKLALETAVKLEK